MLSSASKDVLAKVRQMVPPMLEKFHKGLSNRPLCTHETKIAETFPGQLGRIAVIGGSKE